MAIGKIDYPMKCFSHFAIIIIAIMSLASAFDCCSQPDSRFVRIVELEIDSVHLERFKAALAEDAKAAVLKETGVLTLHAVYDKDHPTHVTVFEIYENEDAHKSHQQTEHFLKYKKTTTGMVKSVLRKRVIPIALETKSKL
jgi:quinol monooxygenase YgiN